MDKVCKICGKAKKINEFPASLKHKDGYRVECKKCTNEINRKSYHKNKSTKGTRKCLWCGGKVKNDNHRCCSNSCSAKFRFKEMGNHPRYKGLDGNTASIHRWVNKYKGGRPETCESCGNKPERGKDGRATIQWCNLSGDYRRDLNDWKAMCISCHQAYDQPWLKRKRDAKGKFLPRTTVSPINGQERIS